MSGQDSGFSHIGDPFSPSQQASDLEPFDEAITYPEHHSRPPARLSSQRDHPQAKRILDRDLFHLRSKILRYGR